MSDETTFSAISRILESEPEHTPGSSSPEPDWKPLCVCGHMAEHHSADIGGDHPTSIPGGFDYSFHGCTGAMRSLGRRRADKDEQGKVAHRNTTMTTPDGKLVMVVPVTCPCTEFRQVAEVNRLGGRFRQRAGRGAHPMVSGLRGLSKVVKGMSEKTGTPAAEIFDARFRWTVPLTCAQCAGSDDVFPSYTAGGRDSALLCTECREKARATLIL